MVDESEEEDWWSLGYLSFLGTMGLVGVLSNGYSFRRIYRSFDLSKSTVQLIAYDSVISLVSNVLIVCTSVLSLAGFKNSFACSLLAIAFYTPNLVGSITNLEIAVIR